MMPATTFEKYQEDWKNKSNDIKVEEALWDEPFTPINKIGILADNFDELINLFMEAIKALRAYKPKHIQEMHWIAHGTGILKQERIFGSRIIHNEKYMEVTKEAEEPVLRFLHSCRKLKQKIEEIIGVDAARKLYHNIAISLRYLNETEEVKKGHEEDLINSSSNIIESSQYFGAFQYEIESGFLFAGDLPHESYSKRVDEIRATLEKLKSRGNSGKERKKKYTRVINDKIIKAREKKKSWATITKELNGEYNSKQFTEGGLKQHYYANLSSK